MRKEKIASSKRIPLPQLVAILGVCIAFCVTSSAFAGSRSSSEPPETTLEGGEADSSGFTGSIDLRPSFEIDKNKAFSFNNAELGYRITPDFVVSYQQYFINQFQQPTSGKPIIEGFDGVLKFKLLNLWTSSDRKASFSDEIQFNFPTDPVKAEAGMLLNPRNAFVFKYEFTGMFSVTLKEIPMYYINTQFGYETPDPENSEETLYMANPVFENFLCTSLDWKFGRSGWAFSLPFYLDTVQYANFDERADLNASWNHLFYIYPELTYTTDSHITMGAAYQSGFLYNYRRSWEDASKDEGIESGIIRLILKTSF